MLHHLKALTSAYLHIIHLVVYFNISINVNLYVDIDIDAETDSIPEISLKHILSL